MTISYPTDDHTRASDISGFAPSEALHEFYDDCGGADNVGYFILRTRDSDPLEESNACVIQDELEQFDEADVYSGRAGCWAYGWRDEFFYRITDAAGNETPVARYVMDTCEQLRNYPVLDEADYSEREWQCAVETLHCYAPSDFPSLDESDWIELADVLLDNECYYEHDGSWTAGWDYENHRRIEVEDMLVEALEHLAGCEYIEPGPWTQRWIEYQEDKGWL